LNIILFLGIIKLSLLRHPWALLSEINTQTKLLIWIEINI